MRLWNPQPRRYDNRSTQEYYAIASENRMRSTDLVEHLRGLPCHELQVMGISHLHYWNVELAAPRAPMRGQEIDPQS